MNRLNANDSPLTTQAKALALNLDPATPAEPVGAYIEGVIDFRRAGRPLERRVLIEDMAQASTLAGFVGDADAG